MKHTLIFALHSLAASTALAAPILAPTLTAPTELQLGETEVYKLSVRNNGDVAASGVVLRMPLPAGMTAQGPLPTTCVAVTEAYGNAQNVRQVRCSPGSVPARRSRDFSIVMVAPAQQMTVNHELLATSTNAPSVVSAAANTRYRYFDVAITPGTHWEMRSCNNGTAGPLANSICPPGSEVVGEVVLEVGGAVTDMLYGEPGYSWLQTNPHVLRLEGHALTGALEHFANLSAINSRCFRGPGETVPQQLGAPRYYTASKICKL